MQKIERDGKVAVLYSPGYGAGWSTWANWSRQEILCMDAAIVQAVLDDDRKQAALIAQRMFPDMYTGGAEQLVVAWVPKGQAFDIQEYDGDESLVIIGQQQQQQYMIA